MDFKELGFTRVKVPDVGLGTWRYAGGTEQLIKGIELGACFIDTAEPCGSEEVVGEPSESLGARFLLQPRPRHEIFGVLSCWGLRIAV